MTVQQAIEKLDNLKPNSYSVRDKLAWLSRLEAAAYNDVLATHKDAPERFEPVTDADMARELTMPSPYDEAYIFFLGSQVDYNNGEIDKYNNSNEMFEKTYGSYRNWYNRTHEPVGERNRYW